MKKLVVFAVALIAAVMSQAAMVDWKYDAAATDAGQVVYVLMGTTATTEWDSQDAVAAQAIGTGTVAKSGRSYSAMGTAESENLSKENASIYYVIVAADASSFSVTSVSDMSASVYGAQDNTPGNNTSLSSASITVAGKSFGGNPPPGPTPVDTPEPTSGLLLLVGGAALALRRKQK